MASTLPDELTLSQIWNAQWLATPLVLADGRDLRVVYRGVWTHGLGPDFSNAYLDIGGCLVRGAVEIHRSASDWNAHGHDRDPTYDDVALHVVWHKDSGGEVRRSDGGSVPMLVPSECLPGSVEAFADGVTLRPLGAIGFEYCAPSAARDRPDDVVAVWERAGDERMRHKTDAVAARLADEPPGQVLYALLLDSLGFTRNRAGMRQVAERLPYDHLDARLLGAPASARFERAAGLLLGVAGFLPLSPTEQETAGLRSDQRNGTEHAWERLGTAWRSITVSPTVWNLARVRPVAHPIRRLMALAVLLARLESGLLEDLCQQLAADDAYGALQRWLTHDNPYLGRAHAHEMIVNVIVPFGLAYGDSGQSGDLVDQSMRLWGGLSAGSGNAIIRRMVDQVCGDHPLRVTSARAEQGLLHLHQSGCTLMRCFECPIAQLELMVTRETPST